RAQILVDPLFAARRGAGRLIRSRSTLRGSFAASPSPDSKRPRLVSRCAIVPSRSPSKKRTRTGPGGVSLWGLAEVATGPRACGGLGRRGSRRRVPFSPAPVARARGLLEHVDKHLGWK